MSSNEFLVERSTVVNADTSKIFALINDFHQWTQWSPWEGLDPAMQRTYAGPDSGVGASYAWSGNKKAGSGSMSITESVPNERVVLDLSFLKPFKAQNVTTFLLEPQGENVAVTWRMTGKKNFFFKAFGFIFSMDKMVGKDFEKGLAQLKAVAEKG
ncbi:SRPBCC family protein [Rhodococcus sp. IEGM 1379]|uniref:SRPBCC family protein n=1 Tax=Rhodococcus sp. IEGM 1379 TaxID=3047086 RepID=UPI0024B87202|nr:SRPBCC family protein [Rhodococcus sp. IEGM 1379]MDI9917330.1 SRPBCC family protein [Rhodococcus sp. IEGM 1379]